LLNWGLWRERGTVRTSITMVTLYALRSEMNSFSDLVE